MYSTATRPEVHRRGWHYSWIYVERNSMVKNHRRLQSSLRWRYVLHQQSMRQQPVSFFNPPETDICNTFHLFVYLLQRSNFSCTMPSFSVDTKEREALDGQMNVAKIPATARRCPEWRKSAQTPRSSSPTCISTPTDTHRAK